VHSVARETIGFQFPDPGYMQYVENQARNAGVVVPFINNDIWTAGHNAPGTGVGQVDIYGHSENPFKDPCDDLDWNNASLPDGSYRLHEKFSPSTPHAIPEVSGDQKLVKAPCLGKY